jgi:hypothetical protein
MINKLTKLFLSVILIFTFVKISGAGDRMMIIEFFTSSTCSPCASNNPTLTAFMQSQDAERITAIGYHMNWPSPGNDPMYLYNSTDNTSRRTYYGINSIPQSQFDGTINIQSSYSQSTFLSYYNQKKDSLSPVTIILTDSTLSSDSMLVRAKVYCETYISNPTVTVYLALVEGHIHYSSAPGTNGETDFYYVMRKMLPNGNGTQVTLFPGQTTVIEQRYKKDTVWTSSEMYPMAFVQNSSTKEILNAAKKTSNFTLLANPAYYSVTQGQASIKTYKVSVPLVASGYTSAVTLTDSIAPANSGISVSFPNGNVLSSFPDSLSVQVSSTASVPTGTYKIIVTGTNASGKYHKISMDYLVGKNYVSVKTNQSNLNFMVNGTTYYTPQLFNWNIGSTQTLQAISPQTSGSTKYVFTSWSHNNDTALTQNITVSSSVSTYIANYKTQFRLLAYSSPSALGVTITNANTYFDSSSVINVSVSPTQVQYNGKTYYFNYWIGSGSGSYNGTNSSFQLTMNNAINEVAIFDTVNVGVKNISIEIPDKYVLYQNYPNPFNPETKIKFDIPKSGMLKLRIYDLLGKEVKTLYSGYLNAGKYEYSFNGMELASGIYIYKLETDNFKQIMKMVLIK